MLTLPGCLGWQAAEAEPDDGRRPDAAPDLDVDTDTDTDADTDGDADDPPWDTETGMDTDTASPYADCDEVMSESHYCYAFTHTELVAVGLDSGDLCLITEVDLPDADDGPIDCASTAWLGGEHIYFCTQGSDQVARVSMLDGSMEVHDNTCWALAEYDGGLLMLPSWADSDFIHQLYHYESWDLLLADDGELIYPVSYHATRLTTRGDLAYMAWHSTNEIEVFALPDGEQLPSIWLEDYDTWVMGMAVTDDDLLVLNAAWPEERLAVFDLATGDALWNVEVPWLRGLSCVTN